MGDSPARESPEALRNKWNGKTERNGLAVVIPLRNKRNGQNGKCFDSYCILKYHTSDSCV